MFWLLTKVFIFFWGAFFLVGSAMGLFLGTGPQTPARWVMYPAGMLIGASLLYLVFRTPPATGTGDHTPRPACPECRGSGTRYAAGGYAIQCAKCNGRGNTGS